MSLTTLVSARSDCVMRSALSIQITSVARAAALLCLLGFVANQGYSEEILLGDPSLTAGVPGNGPISMGEIETWLDDERISSNLPHNFRLVFHKAQAKSPASTKTSDSCKN